MKKIYLVPVLFLFILLSCRKSDENLDISMSGYPVDITNTSSSLDKWLKDSFNIPWNINVEYRFERFEADYSRNIAPVDLDKVKPSMQAILNCFINPYTNIAGKDFGKIYFPKQWVLYGSGSYNNDNTFVLGSATNARRVDLYDLNNLSVTNGENMRKRMWVVHHEFTHCLNQMIPIPPAYELISKGDYDPAWAGKTEDVVRPLGFISPYASSAYTEDFAEMVGHIVVDGPVWYNNYLNLATETGRARLKEKEGIIYSYLLNHYKVDLYKLQAQVQAALKTNYAVTDPEDITLQFPFRLAGNKVNTITYTPSAAHYTTYGFSAAFNTILTNYKNALQVNNWYLQYIQFIFNSATSVTFRVAFLQGATGTTTFFGDYNFNMSVNTITGITTFTKAIPEGTGTTYSNGQIATVVAPFETYILPYLTNRQFVAAYLPTGITATNPLYRTFAGFYVSGTPTNYFYGPVTYK